MKCIHCFREINDGIKFCNYCGTMQPLDREAYEREHPELAEAISEDEMKEIIEEQKNVPIYQPQNATVGQEENYSPNSVPSDPVPQQIPDNSNEPYAGNEYTPNRSLDATLMQCPECGNMIAADSASCPFCGCPFVAPSQQWQQSYAPSYAPAPMGYPANEPPRYQYAEKKEGLSSSAKALITISVIALLAAAGFAVYYFFFMNKASHLEVNPETITFTRLDREKTVMISTDANDFEVTQQPSWVTVEKNGNNTITLICNAPLDDEKDGVVVITAGDLSKTITVKQSSGATRIELDPQSISASHKSNNYVITVETDGDVTAFNFDIPYFCSISEKTPDSFTVSVQANSSTARREGTITIASGNMKKTINIGQSGQCAACEGSGKITCYNCNGTGKADSYYYDEDDILHFYDCYECDGSGRLTCSACDGTGNNRYE